VTADLILHNAREVATCAGPAPRRGDRQADASILRHASIAARGDRLVFVGPADECRTHVTLEPGGIELDASACSVLPGFVDAHTHLVFAGDRRAELLRRLGGVSYEAIAAEGGGILATVEATRRATEEELAAGARLRLQRMLACGTTTAEVKSGYGLALEHELKMLRAVRRLNSIQPIELAPTFLGAHELPPEFRSDPSAYVRLVSETMIPAVADAGLAEACDVFCERGAFSVEHSRTVLRAARTAGLLTRVHAEEFGTSGGAALAAEVGARSADHLVFVTPESARTLAHAGTVAILLPAAAFYLKLGRYAPARLLIDENVPIALGTDFNPGPGLTVSMPFVLTLACFGMALTLQEAIVAATINSAYALNRHEQIGSLEAGKQFDAVVLSGSLDAVLSMSPSPVRQVIKRGRTVYESRPLSWGPRSRPSPERVQREK
jgi:imidazolonepropionase